MKTAMTRYACTALVCTASLVTHVTHAAAPTPGFYVGGGVGQAFYDIDYSSQVNAAYAGSDFTVISSSLTRSSDFAGKVYGGYQFAFPLAIELGYVNLGQPKAEYALRSKSGLNQNPFTRNATYKIQGIDLSAVGTWAITDAWSLHANVGAFFSELKYSEQGSEASGDAYSFSAPNDHHTNVSYGVGGAYRFAGNWAVRLDWDRYQDIGQTFSFITSGNGQFDHVDLVTLNLEYHF